MCEISWKWRSHQIRPRHSVFHRHAAKNRLQLHNTAEGRPAVRCDLKRRRKLIICGRASSSLTHMHARRRSLAGPTWSRRSINITGLSAIYRELQRKCFMVFLLLWSVMRALAVRSLETVPLNLTPNRWPVHLDLASLRTNELKRNASVLWSSLGVLSTFLYN